MKPICEMGHHVHYSDTFEAFFCIEDDRWLEGRCRDKLCVFCGLRPEFPSQILV